MGGAAVRPLKKCGGRAIELENIVVTFEMSGAHGPEFGRFVLEDAVSYDDHYYLGGGFECRDVPKGFAACRDIVHRVTQRSAKEIGTLAFEIVGPLIQNCETLDAGRQARLATCVDSASDVNALDACFLQAHGLPSEPDGADGPGRPPGSLPRSCERFLAAYESCIETMPEAARAPVRDGLEQMRRAWADAPHDALESGCQAAFDAARDSLSTICPGVWPDAPSHP